MPIAEVMVSLRPCIVATSFGMLKYQLILKCSLLVLYVTVQEDRKLELEILCKNAIFKSFDLYFRIACIFSFLK